jgi:ABC-type multidrug transport system fused ATPase/permease subunit
VMAAAAAQGNEFPSIVQDLLLTSGLDDLSQEAVIGLTGAVAVAFLLAKSAVNLIVLRRVFHFLANRAALVSARLSAQFFSSSLLVVQARPSQETAFALGVGANAAVVAVLGSGIILVSEMTLLVLLGVALLFIDPLVTVGAVAYFGVIAGVMQKPLSRWSRKTGTATAAAEIASTTIVQEASACYRELAVFDRVDFYRDHYREQRFKSTGAFADSQYINLIPKSAMEAALVVGGALLVLSQVIAQDAVAAIGTLVVFLAAGTRVMPSLLKVQGALAVVHSSAGAAEKTFALADSLGPQERPSKDAVPAELIRERIDRGNPNFTPTLEVSRVSLAYPGSAEVALKDVNLSLRAGGSLALVGATGSGKSTLSDVILGNLSPDEGTVLIGGERPAEAIMKWAGGIAYVPQEVALSHGTVRDNVALGLPPAAIDDARVWEALERAHLADFLRTTARGGLDTLIGERGVRLSGGQRQRLGVARALYSRPQLLVLDEATSALDAETEHAIADTLSSLEGTVTTVTVAHRLATIRHADLVVYLERGCVSASGTFDEVRSAVPRFNHQAELLGL